MGFLQPLTGSFQQCLTAALPHQCEDDPNKTCVVSVVATMANPQSRCIEAVWRTTFLSTGIVTGTAAISHTARALHPQTPLSDRINGLAIGAMLGYIAYHSTLFGLTS